MLFTKPKRSVGIDVGTHSVKAVSMTRHGGRLRVDQVGYALIDKNQYNADPILAQADALTMSLYGMPISKSLLVGALPGQTVVIRYPRFSDMPNEQLSMAVEREAGQNIPYDLSEVFLDWSLLDTYQDGDSTTLKVVLVAAKHEIIDSRVQIADAASLQYGVLSVDSLALADAADSCGMLQPDETVALINLGASSTSIHFMRDGVSNFIRDVSWGARELISAVSKARRVEYAEAEQLLARAYEHEGREPVLLEPEPETPAEPEAEAPPSGGNLLDPLEDELGGLGELGGLDESTPTPAATSGPQPGGSEEKSMREMLEPALQRLVAEVRRSFDFYEQQLYERPVDRILLSGGAADIPYIRDIMVDELDTREIEIANPSSGAIEMGNDASIDQLAQHPAQYMVAVGLAARGMSEL